MSINERLTDFDYFMDAIDLSTIERVMDLPIPDEEKKIVLAYILSKPLEGISITFPKKAHNTSYAKVLIARGVELPIIADTLELTIKTLNKYKVVTWVRTDKESY